jgi:soluble lytic murein transglycosylase-like protein
LIGVLSFLFVGIYTPPTLPSVPTEAPTPPDMEEIAQLEKLADWLVGPEAGRRSLSAELPEDLSAALGREQGRRTFELFQSRMDDTSRRELLSGLPYGRAIEATADRHEVDSLLLAALVQVESSFTADAVSPVGAVGLTQVMPSTARWIGARGDLTDPASNLDAGARYLARLLKQFDGDLELSLAAYNAGPNAVRRYDGVPPYRETRQYVRKVLSVYVDHHRQAWRDTSLDPIGELAELHVTD